MTAFVLAIVVVGERPGAVALGGLSLVFAGLLLVVWFETRKGTAGRPTQMFRASARPDGQTNAS
jgi:DME family drug/metabolite transporter